MVWADDVKVLSESPKPHRIQKKNNSQASQTPICLSQTVTRQSPSPEKEPERHGWTQALPTCSFHVDGQVVHGFRHSRTAVRVRRVR